MAAVVTIETAQASEPNTYWLSIDDGATWTKVTEDQWCAMEEQLGFRGGRPATAGFGSGIIRGHMHYGWSRRPCEYGPCATSGGSDGAR